MALRVKDKRVYKAPKLPRPTDKDKIIENINWLRFSEEEIMDSIYVTSPELIRKPLEGTKLKTLHGFEVSKYNKKNNKDKFVIMNIEDENGHISEDRCVNINDLHKEEYYDAVEKHEDQLVAIGFTTHSELNEDRIDDPLKIYTYKINDEININCPKQQAIVSGRITKKRLPSFWQQLNIKPYYFKATKRCDNVSDQWIYQCMINTTNEYEQIT
eukprot:103087_1